MIIFHLSMKMKSQVHTVMQSFCELQAKFEILITLGNERVECSGLTVNIWDRFPQRNFEHTHVFICDSHQSDPNKFWSKTEHFIERYCDSVTNRGKPAPSHCIPLR